MGEPRLIGFCGAAAAGKSCAAEILVRQHGFRRMRFAAPLKAMLRALGLSEREIDGDRKETPCTRLMGRTPRHAMQTLGTESRRLLIAPDLWVELWRQDAEAALAAGERLVADDVRFENEAAALRALEGKLVALRREGASPEGAHVSERQRLTPDASLFNEGIDKGVLAARLEGVLERLGAP